MDGVRGHSNMLGGHMGRIGCHSSMLRGHINMLSGNMVRITRPRYETDPNESVINNTLSLTAQPYMHCGWHIIIMIK